jgi:hypothetical protein
MKRFALIAGVAAVVLVLGIFAFAHRPGLAFAHPPGMELMGHAGMHGMGPGMLAAGGAGCPGAAEATLTPEQQRSGRRPSPSTTSSSSCPAIRWRSSPQAVNG